MPQAPPERFPPAFQFVRPDRFHLGLACHALVPGRFAPVVFLPFVKPCLVLRNEAPKVVFRFSEVLFAAFRARENQASGAAEQILNALKFVRRFHVQSSNCAFNPDSPTAATPGFRLMRR